MIGDAHMIPQKKLVSLIAICSLAFGNVYAGTTNPKPDDATITKKVEAKMKKDKELSNLGIIVETKDSVVILKGKVKNKKEASHAVELTQSVQGVSDVDTAKLDVEGNTNDKSTKHTFKDAYITSKVKGVFLRDKLFGDKPISVTSIHVETKDGVVYLTGTVENETVANDAVALAKAVKDVKDVNSKITIKAKSH